MGLFRSRTPKPDLSGLGPLDAELMTQLREQGADLSEPRHVLHYNYFPSRDTAQQAADAARLSGWETTVTEPLEQFPDQWGMRAERPDVVLSNDVVRESSELFGALAAQHGGEYDGWEAAAH